MKQTLRYTINSQLELNLSYMPFIKNGGLFIPTEEPYPMGNQLFVELKLPGHNEVYNVEGKVVWINPSNALYHIYRGVGVQLVGENAKTIHDMIKANIDNTLDVGGYVYGMSDEQIRK